MWFLYQQAPLALPARPYPFSSPVSEKYPASYIPRRGRFAHMKPGQFENSETQGGNWDSVWRTLQNDSRHYKNVTVTIVHLPETPMVSNVRRRRSRAHTPSKRVCLGRNATQRGEDNNRLCISFPTDDVTDFNIPKGLPIPGCIRDSSNQGSYMSIRSEPQWAASLSYGPSAHDLNPTPARFPCIPGTKVGSVAGPMTHYYVSRRLMGRRGMWHANEVSSRIVKSETILPESSENLDPANINSGAPIWFPSWRARLPW